MWVKKIEHEKTKLILPLAMRNDLKEPMGLLLTQDPTEKLLSLIKEKNPPLLIMVGDYCVGEAVKYGLIPDIAIIDGMNLREPYQKISILNAKVIKSTNPPATITKKTWLIIEEIIQEQTRNRQLEKSKEPIVLLIDGEEDLLVIPSVLEAPKKSFVVYGQPLKGIVVVIVTTNVKFKFKQLIERMKVEE